MTQAAALTNAEYALLVPFLSTGTGRPPTDRRRTLDAIFHVVMTRCIWADLPPHLGKPDAAQRQLRRWMRAGVLDRLLIAAARLPAYAGLRQRICRAWRRACRVATVRQLMLAKSLRLEEALPCHPILLPNPRLSESVQKLIFRLLEQPRRCPMRLFRLCRRLMDFAGGRRDLWRTR